MRLPFINTHHEATTHAMPLNSDDVLLYSQRPDWADVQPLEQYEGVNPLAPIFYTDEC